MKIRKGFVSNSSSSSFIIGLGLINDVSKLQEEIKKNSINDRDLLVRTVGDLKENSMYDLNVRNNKLTLDSFLYSSVGIKIDDLDDSSLIAVVSIDNNEGDSCFMDIDDDSYDIDYDIDSSFFDKNQQSIFDIFNDESIIDKDHKDITYGAGRNG
jgi:hypothetical protein